MKKAECRDCVHWTKDETYSIGLCALFGDVTSMPYCEEKSLRPAAPGQACKNCRYSRDGECRRHAPICDADGLAQFPKSLTTPWCGDWESR